MCCLHNFITSTIVQDELCGIVGSFGPRKTFCKPCIMQLQSLPILCKQADRFLIFTCPWKLLFKNEAIQNLSHYLYIETKILLYQDQSNHHPFCKQHYYIYHLYKVLLEILRYTPLFLREIKNKNFVFQPFVILDIINLIYLIFMNPSNTQKSVYYFIFTLKMFTRTCISIANLGKKA